MPTHEELARFMRQFNRLPLPIRAAFLDAVAALVEDLTGKGFDPTSVRPSLRLHKLGGTDAWSVSFAGQWRAVFRLGVPKRPGHAHLVWEFIGSHTSYEQQY